MTLKKWLKTPKSLVVFALLSFLLIASIVSGDRIGIINAGVAVFVSVIIDMLLSVLKKRKWSIPDGAMITGLILALILGTTSSYGIIAGTAALAILSKHLLVYKKKPIFNPAAFGLLLSIPLFQTEQSWWGAFGDLPVWTLIFLLAGGYAVSSRVNKFPQVFSFLGTSFLLLVLMGHYGIGDAVDALRPPFINATLFFGFFMLTDPPTSPGKDKDQVAFGILTAVAGTVIYGLFGGLMYLYIGLCVGNLYSVLKKRLSSKASTKRTASRSTRALASK